MAKKLTSRKQDYSQWYNEIIQRADLAENSGVRGCMVIKPYGYAIWEKMQAELDRILRKLVMRMLISLLFLILSKQRSCSCRWFC